MSTMEIVVIGVGLAIGYKFVSAMMVSPKGDAHPGPGIEPPLRIDTRRPWHEVLGVSADATRAEIERAYRALIEQYHPEKFDQHGDDIREIARKRATELNAAYDEGCALRPD